MRHDLAVARIIISAILAMGLLFASAGCSDEVDPVTHDVGTDADESNDVDVGVDDAGDAGPVDDTDPIEDTGPDVIDEPDVPGDPDAGPEEDTEPEPLPDLAVDELRPERGPIDGGTPFVVEGEGFTDATTVLFGPNSVQTDLVDDTLTGITPAGEVLGPVTVRVVDDETGEQTLVDGFRYIEPLEVDAVQPTLLPVAGGTEVTVNGRGFSEDTSISVGGRAAAQHTLVDNQTLRFIAPSNAAGPADVRASDTNGSATKTDAVTYIRPMELHAVTPPYGTIEGGDEVVVSGIDFDASLQVFFDETTANVVDVADNGTEATVITPAASAGAVDVRVETDDDGARLDDGFVYIDTDDDQPAIDEVVPDRGSTAGGDRVYLTGYFGDFDAPEVQFGDAEATVVDVDDHVIAVDTPAVADAGAVDIIVDDGTDSVSADDAFGYFEPLSIAELDPAQGSVDGGTSVTVTGTGFSAVETVRLTGLSVAFEVEDDETLTLTTPAAGPGVADLALSTDDGRSLLEEEAYFYVGALELWNFSPTQGSIAGNTYVEIGGSGFSEQTQFYFGDLLAEDIDVDGPFSATVRTPPGSTGSVEVSAEQPDAQAQAPDLFTYFNPGAQTGGAWGNPIDGAVNVTVFSIGGGPVEGAYVMLSTSAQTPYSGITDAGGLVTLSGPDVLGQQTITATAPGHSSATVQNVDAENITVFLQPEADGDPQFPPPPPTATFHGDITGLDKLDQPAPNEVLMAIVETTRPSLDDELPDPGGGNVVTEDGEYIIQTRVGELALVAIGGLYNVDTEQFRPTRMGTARHLTAADGGTYEEDIDLDIPLNDSITMKLDGAPLSTPGGPNTNRAHLFLDLNVDGFFGPMHEYTTNNDLKELGEMAPLIGDIDDASYYLRIQTDLNGGIPLSQTFIRNIDELGETYVTPPMASTIDFVTPSSGGVPTDGLVQWELHGAYPPDFYYVFVETFMQETVWEIFLPGDVTSFQFPDFPEFDPDDFDEEEGLPLPYPGGSYQMVVVGYRKDGLTAENFSYDDLNPATASGYSLAAMMIGF